MDVSLVMFRVCLAHSNRQDPEQMASPQLHEQQIQSIASALKAAREQQGENLAEVAFRIALSPSQLRAIEAGDLQPFYSPGYFLQAVQRYADFLGVTLPSVEPEPSAPPSPERVAAPDSNDQTQSATDESATTDKPVIPASDRSGETVEPDSVNAQHPQADHLTPHAQHQSDGPHHSTEEPRRGLPWGWVAFGTAALIALGILKISLEKPAPTQEPIASAEPTKAQDSATPTTEPPSTATAPAGNAPAVAATTSAPSPSAAPKAPPTASPTPTTAPVATTTTAKAGAVAPMTSTTPAAGPATNTTKGTSSTPVAAAKNDSQLESQASTWVQLVKSNGEKVNLKVEPGQTIDFPSATTAAIVFGQPDKATLKVQGKTVNISPFVTTDTPPRALVILNQIK